MTALLALWLALGPPPGMDASDPSVVAAPAGIPGAESESESESESASESASESESESVSASASDRDPHSGPRVGPEAESAESAGGRGDGKVVSEGDVAIRASVEPDPSNIGDLLLLRVVVAYPKGYAVNLPTALDFAPLHLVEAVSGEPEPTGQELRKTFEIRLQHFAVGTGRVPSFPITYVTDAGEVHTLDVPAVEFTVESLLANENDPQRKGEDPPISIEYPNELAETIVWSVLGTMLAALGAWMLLRRLLRREKPVRLPPPIPAHEVAFAALDELSRGELLANERWPDYYLQLTEIAKAYLEGRFGVEALDRTTDEIRRELVRDPGRVAPLTGPDVVELLQRCDLVKFARFAPPRDDAEHDLGEVRRMVERSIAQPAAPAKVASEAASPSAHGEAAAPAEAAPRATRSEEDRP